MTCHNFLAASLNAETELLLCTSGWIWHYGCRFSSAESCAFWIALGRVNKPGRVWHHLVFPQAPWARWHYQISFESKHAFLTLLRKKHWICLLFLVPLYLIYVRPCLSYNGISFLCRPSVFIFTSMLSVLLMSCLSLSLSLSVSLSCSLLLSYSTSFAISHYLLFPIPIHLSFVSFVTFSFIPPIPVISFPI